MEATNLGEKLSELNLGCIVVVDDAEENLNAISKVAADCPGVNWVFLDNGAEAIKFINEKHREIDLLITDRQMETTDAGLEVLGHAYSFLIPTVIVSGGFHHAGKMHVRIYPIIENPPCGRLPDDMFKDNPETWRLILDKIILSLDPQSGGILYAASLAHKEKPEAPAEFGNGIKKLAKYFLNH